MWPIPQFPTVLVTFTEKILNGKLHFLCRVKISLKKESGVISVTAVSKFEKLKSMPWQNV